MKLIDSFNSFHEISPSKHFSLFTLNSDFSFYASLLLNVYFMQFVAREIPDIMISIDKYMKMF